MTAVPSTLSTPVCNSFLPPMPEAILLGKGENECFLRDNEKKVNEGKPRVEARVCQSATILET